MNTLSATVIGSLVGGGLLFLSSIIVPIVTKKLNKATDAAASAEKISTGAEKNAAMALRISEGLEKKAAGLEEKLTTTEKQCNNCLERLSRRDRTLDAVHAALTEVLPLMNSEDRAYPMIQAVIASIASTRIDDR